MIVKNIEAKVRLATFLSAMSFVLALAISLAVSYFAYRQVSDSRKSIYVLQDGVNPMLAKRTDIELNRGAEYRAHIARFHTLFFSLIPDERFIESQMREAMYLIDESGAQQYNNLKERNFFSAVLSSSAVLTIRMDSISLDEKRGYFRYYATQRIDRKSAVTLRSLITEGRLRDLPARSEHNPHAVLITAWKTLENQDRSTVEKNPL
ncbi:MAG: conjugative transposon protein TraK [Chryseobacterium sp.]|uniref:Conjugative transposon protein TraK n=1 Tax=Pedobacter agri TaxID=454586 RepID=A0A9X3I8N4_9SPHI|nr:MULTISPECIES: conjugative transposon protein TraK [Pedobacter]AZI25813.1 conjugative transposon protein TraK [Pedobacter sp. G11]MCX3263668.1 conjugative transposon protein TraK [Pedobacter agri]MDQ1141856.1 conjugative transposon TraK protein [Pedobacter agri]RZJ92557.1 MAG: conjugative transposon protein TraK [Chryseobacterium sp.]